MANSARDPLWRAVVSFEVAQTPSRKDEIETECLKCHAPMAQVIGLEKHEDDSFMHALDCGGRLGDLARDGVSCTICHGITPDGLGTRETFSGQFKLDQHMRLYGPHKEPSLNPMQLNTGFTPTHGEQILSSKLCGSCHTSYTDAYDKEGKVVGAGFLEQAPYLEWRNSNFSGDNPQEEDSERSCQSCHAPTSDIDGDRITSKIARAPAGFDFGFTDERRPFGRHLFVGANTFMLQILRDNAEELGVTAHPFAFDATIEATRAQLRNRSARVSIRDAVLEDEQLRFRIDVQNLAGHKLPTAHPIRRVWLRVAVRDASGSLVFASGSVDSMGRIIDGEGNPLPSELAGGPLQPHRDLVTSSSEVATYEGIMADAQGRPTTTLTRAVRWLVDDRILPRGWSADHDDAAQTAPVGVAGDKDFLPGSDGVRYQVDLAEVKGPLTIEAELLHQSLSARWASELFQVETPEILRFRRMYDASDRSPEVMASEARRIQ